MEDILGPELLAALVIFRGRVVIIRGWIVVIAKRVYFIITAGLILMGLTDIYLGGEFNADKIGRYLLVIGLLLIPVCYRMLFGF